MAKLLEQQWRMAKAMAYTNAGLLYGSPLRLITSTLLK
jgi:hypothetical protein